MEENGGNPRENDKNSRFELNRYGYIYLDQLILHLNEYDIGGNWNIKWREPTRGGYKHPMLG